MQHIVTTPREDASTFDPERHYRPENFEPVLDEDEEEQEAKLRYQI